jgi:hypothetical protein
VSDPVACANSGSEPACHSAVATNTNQNLRMRSSLIETREAVALTRMP